MDTYTVKRFAFFLYIKNEMKTWPREEEEGNDGACRKLGSVKVGFRRFKYQKQQISKINILYITPICLNGKRKN